MKKINFIALIGTAVVMLAVTSCSKGPLATPKAAFKYDNTDVKSIIKLASPDLYTRIYDEKQDPGTITIIKGVHDMSDNCNDEDAICSIIVVTTHPALSVQDSISLYDVDPNLNLTFNKSGDAFLIQVKPIEPTITDAKYIDITVNMNGTKTISYVPFVQ